MLVKILCYLLLANTVYGITNNVICYYQAYASKRRLNNMKPANIDPYLCTHINFAFVGLNQNGSIEIEDEIRDITEGLLKNLTELKLQNTNLKVLLSIGASSAQENFAEIVANSEKRRLLIESANYYISTYELDGLDLDWEFPKETDKFNFVTLLREIKDDFEPKNWLLTIAVSSSPGKGYIIKEINKYVDIVVNMAYNMYGPWSEYTGQNSPLYASSIESSYEKNNLNVAAVIHNWDQPEMDMSKYAVGIAFYGRAFGLTDPNIHDLHAPFSGPAEPQPHLRSGYSYAYSEICAFLGKWTRVWDSEQMVPYKYSDKNWVGYDDIESIKLKIEYAISKNISNIMVWSIDLDDVHGACGENQGLLRAVNEALGRI